MELEHTDLVRFGVSMAQELVEQFDRWCEEVGYGNRSKAIRDLVRKALLATDQMEGDQPVAGTIVMVYDHHAKDLGMQLTELQHDYHHDIVSTMHVHLNHHQCLEIIVVRGVLHRLRELSRRIQVQQGVLFAELSVTHIDQDENVQGFPAEPPSISTEIRIDQKTATHQIAEHDHIKESNHRADHIHLTETDYEADHNEETEPMHQLKADESISGFDSKRAAAFDEIAPMWDGMAGKPDSERLEELLDRLSVKEKVVLDLGAGTGVLVGAGLARKPMKWIACDISKEMLRRLQDKHRGATQLEIMHADVHALPLANASVDRIICHQAFPHFHTPSQALREIHRVLKPGGLFILNHFAGREFINDVHRSASHEILQHDLLMPAQTVSQWIQAAGFAVSEARDEANLYRITAVKMLI